MERRSIEKKSVSTFGSRASVVMVEPFSIEKNAGSGRLKRQIGRCLFSSRAESPQSEPAAEPWRPGAFLSSLPIAPNPIGKVEACGFGIRARNGGWSAAPESLPPKSEIGDGR
jgi:hypothetical protein